ncbi:MAG: hypothetical protein COC15_01890 [Legionellales bacterium]|nr:MAG: hypothetical protein COC15_01890 [Legionellales bacterium]
MKDSSILDFKSQAELILDFLKENNNPATARELLVLKLKTMYQHGVAAGRLYENEGVYPYMDATKKTTETEIA